MRDVQINKIVCLRCNWSWTPRSSFVRLCPHCKSMYWDIPPIQHITKRRKERKVRRESKKIAEKLQLLEQLNKDLAEMALTNKVIPPPRSYQKKEGLK